MTGCCGRLGAAASTELLKSFRAVRGFDCQECPAALKLMPGFEFVRGRLEDANAIHDAVRGVNVVVHLAACPGDADWETALLPSNIVGTVSLLRAIETVNIDVAEKAATEAHAAAADNGGRAASSKRARRGMVNTPKHPVHRLIVASSGKLYAGHKASLPITVSTTMSPMCAYAATKAFIEAATEAFAADTTAGCLSIVLRCGWCPRTAADVGEMRAASGVVGCGADEFLSPRDAASAIRVACTTPLSSTGVNGETQRYVALFVQSRAPPGRHQRFDTSLTQQLLLGAPRPTASCRHHPRDASTPREHETRACGTSVTPPHARAWALGLYRPRSHSPTSPPP